MRLSVYRDYKTKSTFCLKFTNTYLQEVAVGGKFQRQRRDDQNTDVVFSLPFIFYEEE